MKVLRARCADCSYGSLSPVPISMMMEQQHMQLNTGHGLPYLFKCVPKRNPILQHWVCTIKLTAKNVGLEFL